MEGISAEKEADVGSDAESKFSVTLVRNVVILACAIDAADKALLPATFKALSLDLNVGPKELGYLSFAQSISFSLALPVWGSLMRSSSARELMTWGCFLWAAATLALACTKVYMIHFILRLVVGAALAVVMPVGQAVICDIVAEGERGWSFGLLSSVSAAFTIAVSFVATSFATVEIRGFMGWQWAYAMVAGLSGATGLAVWILMPKTVSSPRPPLQTSWLAEQARVVTAVASKPSFVIMVAQGVTGGIPWNAFAFLTFYFQLSGYSDLEAGQITFFGGLGGIVGGLLGGFLGDYANRLVPDRGRVAVAQLSVVAGTLVFLWLIYLPYDQHSIIKATVVFFLFHSVATWTQSAALRPICGTLFQDSNNRAQVLALWLALEGIIASICGAPLVGVLSEVFGYQLRPGETLATEGGKASLDALRKSLVGVSLVPWVLCALAWLPMYWTYPNDRAALETQSLDAKDRAQYQAVPETIGSGRHD